jgi:hypothetical protein
LNSESFRSDFEAFSAQLSGRLRGAASYGPEAPFTHLLKLDRSFLDFLRLSAGISRIKHEGAMQLKVIVDEAIEEFTTP